MAAGGSLSVDFDNGASLVLSNGAPSTTMTGTYTVGVMGSLEDSSDLNVVNISAETAVDSLGNARASLSSLPVGANLADAYDFVVDTTAPNAFSMSIDITGIYDKDNPEISFVTTDDGVGMDRYEVQVDGGGYTVQSSPYTPALAVLATHTVNVRAYDLAGNYYEHTLSYPPVVNISAPTILSTGTITDGTLTVTGPNDISTVVPAGGIDSSFTCDPLPAASPVSCTFDITASGTLTVTATDTAAAVGVSTQDYVVDSVDPNLSSFTVGSENGTYGPGALVSLFANYDEDVQQGSTLNVTLDTGESVLLTAASDGTQLSGVYTVGATGSGQTSSDLTVSSLAAESVMDIAGNSASSLIGDVSGSNIADSAAIVVDTTAPVISQTTPVSSPSNDATPSYSFTSDEVGTLSFSGSCSSVTTAVLAALNTIDLDSTGLGNTLSDGVYTDCDIQVSDSVDFGSANTSSTLEISDFTVDTLVPVLESFSSTASSGVHGPSSAIVIRANYSEVLGGASTMDVTLNNGALVSLTATGADAFLSGTYNVAAGNSEDIDSLDVLTLDTESVSDLAGNAASTASIDSLTNLSSSLSIEVDTTAPLLAETTPVPSGTQDGTPDYTFYSSEAGSINVSGSCGSVNTAASIGDNIITLDSDGAGGALTVGAYTDCSLTVTDSVDFGSGNVSSTLAIADFSVDSSAPVLQSITSSTLDGTYQEEQSIVILMNYNETLATLSSASITLDNGAKVSLIASSEQSYLQGTYGISELGLSEDSLDLTVASIDSEAASDIAGNVQSSSTVAGIAGNNLGDNSNLVVDNSLPSMSFTDDVNAGGTSDTIAVQITDTSTPFGTLAYKLIAGSTCDASTYVADPDAGTVFTLSSNSATLLTLSDETFDGQYVCMLATDALGNSNYLGSSVAIDILVGGSSRGASSGGGGGGGGGSFSSFVSAPIETEAEPAVITFDNPVQLDFQPEEEIPFLEEIEIEPEELTPEVIDELLDEMLASCDDIFADTVGHFSKNAVCHLYNLGVLKGRDNDLDTSTFVVDPVTFSAEVPDDIQVEFNPDAPINRVEFLKMLLEAFDLEEDAVVFSDFTDVDSQGWYANYVNLGVQYSLVTGYEDQTFRPGQFINRAEAVTLVMRLIGLFGLELENQGDDISFTDVPQFSWFEDPVARAAANGLIRGYADGSFKPDQNISRGESAVLFSRLLVLVTLESR